MAQQGNLKTLPLEGLHRAAGARFGAFAGWSMPLTYPDGVMKEHLHTRDKAGLFDISHMKLFQLSGAGAADALARACPLEPAELAEGHSKYTFLLNDRAGIIDDLIVTRLGPERFMMVVNAGNAGADEEHLKAVAADFDCMIEPLERVILALQGPEAEAVLKKAGLDLSALVFMRGTEPRENWFATRSGYTGEDGYEVMVPAARATEFWNALVDEGCAPCGLGARDTLRLEAGMNLYGSDMDESVTPLESGLGWTIAWDPADRKFIGRPALDKQRTAGARRKLVGLVLEDRGVLRSHMRVVTDAGEGETTSGGFGPTVGKSVALARVPAGAGDTVQVDVRGKLLNAKVVKPPFARNGKSLIQ
jgi:aminomethyltransferase